MSCRVALFVAALLICRSIGLRADEQEPFPGLIEGEMSIVIRGPGAAPFGIASALFGSTNTAYHLGELTSAFEGAGAEGVEKFSFGASPMPADESYQAKLRFALRQRSGTEWRLERFSIDYDFVGRTSFDGEGTSIQDVMGDAGWVGWDRGVWSGPEGWKPDVEPKGTLRLFRAATAEDCEAGRLEQWFRRARAVFSDTEGWVTCYQLELAAPHPVRPSGTSEWRSPVANISMKAVNGEVSFSSESAIDLEAIPIPSQLSPGAREFFEQSRKLQRWLQMGFPTVDLGGTWTVDGEFAGVVSDRAISEDVPFTILTGAQARERLFVPLYAVLADPGGPYTVERGQTLQLDGSASQGHDLEYEWSFGPLSAQPASSPPAVGSGGSCADLTGLLAGRQGATLTGNEGAKKTGVQPSVVLLESKEVILQVTDRKTGVRHVASTQAEVVPRDWKTGFHDRANWRFDPPAWQSTWSYPTGLAQTAQSKQQALPADRDLCVRVDTFKMGENWCGRDHPGQSVRGVRESGVIHPHGRMADSWKGKGYSLAKVTDPEGPFDGWHYVESSELDIDREGIFNPTLRPDGPAPWGSKENFFRANVRLGADPAALRAGVEAHEGMGTAGQPMSGHSLIFEEFLAVIDPASEIEKGFAKEADTLKAETDKMLDAIDLCLAELSADPINEVNWQGDYWVWDNGKQEWCRVSGGTM